MITLEQGVELVWHAFEDMVGGEIYVKKIPSMSVVNLAKALAPECKLEVVGIRPGEKLHEQMIGEEDAHYTYEYPDHYKILPVINDWSTSPERIKDGVKVAQGFIYRSDNNADWMTKDELITWVDANRSYIGKI
jgi:FlaA1/EpsC-like NDP-sugar epimerase